MGLLTIYKPFYTALKEGRRFRYLWLCCVVSFFGDWFNFVAALAVVQKYTDSKGLISLYIFFRLFPPVLFSPFLGVAVDKWNRVWLMMTADVGRAVCAVTYIGIDATSGLSDDIKLSLIYAVTVVQFTLAGLFDPARSSILPNLVPRERLMLANGLIGVTWSFSLAVGAAAGGFFADHFGYTANFVVDAMSFLTSALFLRGVGGEGEGEGEAVDEDKQDGDPPRPRQQQERGVGAGGEKDSAPLILKPTSGTPQDAKTAWNRAPSGVTDATRGENSGWFAMWLKGMKYIWGEKELFILCFAKGSLSAVYGGVNALGTIYMMTINNALDQDQGTDGSVSMTATGGEAQRSFESDLGLYWASVGFGTFLGSDFARRTMTTDLNRVRMRLSGSFVVITIGCFVAFGGAKVSMYLFLFGAGVVRCIGELVAFISSMTLLQMRSTDAFRGRVMSFDGAIRFLMESISTLLASAMVDDKGIGWDIQQSLLPFALLAGALALCWFFGYYLVYGREEEVAFRTVRADSDSEWSDSGANTTSNTMTDNRRSSISMEEGRRSSISQDVEGRRSSVSLDVEDSGTRLNSSESKGDGVVTRHPNLSNKQQIDPPPKLAVFHRRTDSQRSAPDIVLSPPQLVGPNLHEESKDASTHDDGWNGRGVVPAHNSMPSSPLKSTNHANSGSANSKPPTSLRKKTIEKMRSGDMPVSPLSVPSSPMKKAQPLDFSHVPSPRDLVASGGNGNGNGNPNAGEKRKSSRRSSLAVDASSGGSSCGSPNIIRLSRRNSLGLCEGTPIDVDPSDPTATTLTIAAAVLKQLSPKLPQHRLRRTSDPPTSSPRANDGEVVDDASRLTGRRNSSNH